MKGIEKELGGGRLIFIGVCLRLGCVFCLEEDIIKIREIRGGIVLLRLSSLSFKFSKCPKNRRGRWAVYVHCLWPMCVTFFCLRWK
jgi:hypothetical protein